MSGREPAGARLASRTVVRTTCGRELVVGRLRLTGLPHPTLRVTLDVGCQPYDRGVVWASLTAAEARQLAGQLLAQAAAADRESAATTR
jgi:putative redox protein